MMSETGAPVLLPDSLLAALRYRPSSRSHTIGAGPSTPPRPAKPSKRAASTDDYAPRDDLHLDQDSSPSKRAKGKARDKSASPKKPIRGYADPSTYSHLQGIHDALAPGLSVVFCGINPGVASATSGHAYAHPTNHFWKLLHGAGFTSSLLKAEQDGDLPALAGHGLTNLVDRPTAEANELSTAECRASVPGLVGKLATYKPAWICFVGKGIADHFVFVLKTPAGAKRLKASIGLQPLRLRHANGSYTRIFVTPSSSGLVQNMQYPAKLELMRAFQTIVDRVAAGDADAVERELVGADGKSVTWHTLYVDRYLATTETSTASAPAT